MIRIVAIVLAIIAIVLMLRHVSRLSQSERKRFNWRLLWLGLFGAVVYLAVTGRLHFIAAIATGLLPFVKKLVPFIRYVPLLRRLYRQAKMGSRMKTSLLVITLDAESGDLDGEIREGPYQGKKLSELNLESLQHVHQVAQKAYPDSVGALEAYLDRQHAGWRGPTASGQQEKKPVTASDMSLSDAYAILGLEENVSKDDVIQAHRKLMQKLHPDRGGSDFLAAQVNLAKELILAELDQNT